MEDIASKAQGLVAAFGIKVATALLILVIGSLGGEIPAGSHRENDGESQP